MFLDSLIRVEIRTPAKSFYFLFLSPPLELIFLDNSVRWETRYSVIRSVILSLVLYFFSLSPVSVLRYNIIFVHVICQKHVFVSLALRCIFVILCDLIYFCLPLSEISILSFLIIHIFLLCIL